MSEETVTIYIYLLDEGVDVWRPVKAVQRGEVYVIISNNLDPDDEHWQFAPGDAVLCQPRIFSGGSQGLVAYANAEQPAV